MGGKTNGCKTEDHCFQGEGDGNNGIGDLCKTQSGGGGGNQECEIKKGWKPLKDVFGGDQSDEVDDKVYLPTRRQCICTQTLKNVTTRDGLITSMLKISVHQGYNLGQYYKQKAEATTKPAKKKEEEEDEEDEEDDTESDDTESDDTTTTYDVSACNAMKYSFYDLRDIILGYDQLETQSSEIETSLKTVFTSSGGGKEEDGKPGSDARKSWWNTNKECIWNAMKCGYKQGYSGGFRRGEADKHEDKIPDGCRNGVPNDKHFPLPNKLEEGTAYQFLRWFAEWSEDFCKQKKTQYEKLEEACKCYKCNGEGETGDDTCDNSGCEECKDRCDDDCKECEKEKETCTAACREYQKFIKDWKSQYLKQKEKYSTDKGNYSGHSVATSAGSAREYLKAQLQNVCPTDGGCNCMAEEGSGEDDMPRSLDEIPDDHKDKCSGAKEGEGDSGGGISESDGGVGGSYDPPPEDGKGKGGGKSKGTGGGSGDKGSDGAGGAGEGSQQEPSSPGTAGGEDADGQGPGPGQQPPPPPQQQQSGDSGGQASGDQVGGRHTTHGSESDGHSHGSQEGGGGPQSSQLQQQQQQQQPPAGGDAARGPRSVPPQQSPQLLQMFIATLPLSVGIALVSISYLLLKKKPKKKPSTRPFYRVVELPEHVANNHDPPYRGKRYIYVEGNGEDPTTDNTASDSDTGSEYEEIFVSRTPKYKTLIDIILEPRNRDNRCHTHTTNTSHGGDTDTYGDAHDTHMTHISHDIHNNIPICHTHNTYDTHVDIPTNTFVSNMLQRKQLHDTCDGTISDGHISDIPISDIPIPDIPISDIPIPDIPIPDISIGDIPTNKPINDNGLIQLKQGFIPNILQCTKTDLSNENSIDDNMYMETQPNILDDIMDEKPFITSIQDKHLHGGYDHSYNISWNVPTNINMITNTVDDPKYVPNNIYTGTDLISDTLSDNIDIYSEMLKRKEKEIYSVTTTYV